ncbi:MAG: 1-deoxy-D-xylulose-5-phosphate reductoisomerase [Planctomycetota bacterium]|nr:1-deoxy-D-xylulose-5-phosphate reductoisomerase [Planctomycetota bacterium]
MKKVVVLGSTGSVGRNALDVARRLPDEIQVVGLAARSNWEVLREQILEFRPSVAALVDPGACQNLRKTLPNGATRLVEGLDGILDDVLEQEADVVLAAITGAAGLPTTLKAVEKGRRLAIANKESLVMAGKRVMALAREKNAEVVPVDSEHSAIFQSMRGSRSSEVTRLLLTGSGGPFRETPANELQGVTREQALNHPTWKMGPKITIDSATLMNKALEVIEARWLFDVPPERIEVVIHPESVVHSMVEFQDGSVIAQLGLPDMRVPIQFALTYPERRPLEIDRLSFPEISRLTFEEPDRGRFPALDLAYRALETGGTLPAVLNAANEQAVERFLAGTIRFPQIASLTRQVMDHHDAIGEPEIPQILEADRWAREEVDRCLS